MQLARLIVRFWPYYPDAFTLATCLKYQQMFSVPGQPVEPPNQPAAFAAIASIVDGCK